MDNIKVSWVNSNEIPENESNVLTEGKLSVDAIPDLEKLSANVLEILQYLEDPQNATLIRDNETGVKMLLNNKYADSVPYGIISLLIDETTRTENAERIVSMLEHMNRAKRGEVSLEEVEHNFTNEINERYIYSKYGSKENFEKALMEDQKKKTKKKVK